MYETAEELGCPVVPAEKTCTVSAASSSYEVVREEQQLPRWASLVRMRCDAVLWPGTPKEAPLQLTSKLCGSFHLSNLEAAVAACLQLRSAGYDISDAAIQAGVAAAALPGRFQVVPIPGAPPNVASPGLPSSRPRAVRINDGTQKPLQPGGAVGGP